MREVLRDASAPEIVENPYALYEELRRDGPVHYLVAQDLWLVIGYEQCCWALEHPELFSSAEALSSTHAFRRDPLAAELLRGAPGYPRTRTLILTDAPEHTRYRQVMSEA